MLLSVKKPDNSVSLKNFRCIIANFVSDYYLKEKRKTPIGIISISVSAANF